MNNNHSVWNYTQVQIMQPIPRALEYYRWSAIFQPYKTRNPKRHHIPRDKNKDMRKTEMFSFSSHFLSSLIWLMQKLDSFGERQWIIKTGGDSNYNCCSRFCLCYGANQHSPSTWHATNELAILFPLCHLA